MRTNSYSKTAFNILIAVIFMSATLLTSCSGESFRPFQLKMDGVYYSLEYDKGNNAIITHYDPEIFHNKTKFEIPETITAYNLTYNVSRIGENAFCNSDLEYIVIGENITFISKFAFKGAGNLHTIMVKGLELPILQPGAFDDTVFKNAVLLLNANTSITGAWENFEQVKYY